MKNILNLLQTATIIYCQQTVAMKMTQSPLRSLPQMRGQEVSNYHN